MFSFLKKFRRDDKGATMIEYGLIAALVSIASIGALTAVGGELKAGFTTIETKLKASNTVTP
jgi:pilus assembly protein Flp/PilA